MSSNSGGVNATKISIVSIGPDWKPFMPAATRVGCRNSVPLSGSRTRLARELNAQERRTGTQAGCRYHRARIWRAVE